MLPPLEMIVTSYAESLGTAGEPKLSGIGPFAKTVGAGGLVLGMSYPPSITTSPVSQVAIDESTFVVDGLTVEKFPTTRYRFVLLI